MNVGTALPMTAAAPDAAVTPAATGGTPAGDEGFLALFSLLLGTVPPTGVAPADASVEGADGEGTAQPAEPREGEEAAAPETAALALLLAWHRGNAATEPALAGGGTAAEPPPVAGQDGAHHLPATALPAQPAQALPPAEAPAAAPEVPSAEPGLYAPEGAASEPGAEGAGTASHQADDPEAALQPAEAARVDGAPAAPRPAPVEAAATRSAPQVADGTTEDLPAPDTHDGTGQDAVEAPGPEPAAEVAGVARVERTVRPAPAMRPEQLQRALVETARQLARQGGGSHRVTVRLDPPDLGQLTIEVVARGSEVRITVRASEAGAAPVVLQQQTDVASALSAEGFQLDGFDVHAGHSDGRDQQQGTDRRVPAAGAEQFALPDEPDDDGVLRI